MTVYGMDLSHFNTLPDNWASQDFVFTKCTQGLGFVDPTYASRHTLLHDANIVFGAYHFMSTNSDGTNQAHYFLNNANLQHGDIAALDFENDGTWGYTPKSTVVQVALDFLQTVRLVSPTTRILLYCNDSTYTDYVVAYHMPLMDGLWAADYHLTPPNEPWLLWQYKNTPYDYDQAAIFPDAAALRAWAQNIPFDPQPAFMLLND